MKIFHLIIVLALVGCSAVPSKSGQVYQRGQALQVQSVQYGVVTSVRPVRIEGTQSGVGIAAGGAIGGLLGSGFGGGNGIIVTSIIGALIGGVSGNAIENQVTSRNGTEVTVKMGNRFIAVVQEADEQFRVGDTVQIITDNITARVTH
jgi:outer membrane lipoprotein SlyB